LDDRFRGLDLLTYFVECWFLMKSFHKAQDDGLISPEEDFDPTFILIDGAKSKRWPYWLSFDVQAKLRDLHKTGQTLFDMPNYWIGVDDHDNYRFLVWLQVENQRPVAIETGMKAHHFRAVDMSDLLQQIAVFELYDAVIATLNGRAACRTEKEVTQRLNLFETSYRLRSTGGTGPK
jgi:hypothetical protein